MVLLPTNIVGRCLFPIYRFSLIHRRLKKTKFQEICDLREYEGRDTICSKHCIVIKTYKLFTAGRK